jgi:hypothetical protein
MLDQSRSFAANKIRVLQEEILTHRGLLFGSRQLEWRCLCGIASERRPTRWDGTAQDHLLKAKAEPAEDEQYQLLTHDHFDDLRRSISQKNSPPSLFGRLDHHYDAWYTMIEDYSTRVLTYDTDVLSAIAGLADAMAVTHGCKYLDGLWEDDLQRGLCWFVRKSKTADRYSTIDQGMQLPSWTWACQWGKPIHFRTWTDRGPVVPIKEDVSCLDASICSAAAVPQMQGSPAIADHKTLRLSGKVIRVSVGERWNIRQHLPEVDGWWGGHILDGQWMWVIRHTRTDEKMGEIALDFNPSGHSLDHVYCILCITREKARERKPSDVHRDLGCLALVPTDDTFKEFRRVGFIVMRNKEWFEGPSFSDPENQGSSESITQTDWETGLHMTIIIT